MGYRQKAGLTKKKRKVNNRQVTKFLQRERKKGGGAGKRMKYW